MIERQADNHIQLVQNASQTADRIARLMGGEFILDKRWVDSGKAPAQVGCEALPLKGR